MYSAFNKYLNNNNNLKKQVEKNQKNKLNHDANVVDRDAFTKILSILLLICKTEILLKYT